MSKKIISFLLCFVFFVISPLQAINVWAQSSTTYTSSSFTFNKDLVKGTTDPDVQKLQVVLNSDTQTQVAASGAGSSGSESTYFGNLTYLAVIKFQEKYSSEILIPNNLTQGTGIVGKSTRAKLNQLIVQKNISFSNLVTYTPSANTSANTVVFSGSQTNLSVCQFIEFLINIQVVDQTKAPQARTALGCSANGADGQINSYNTSYYSGSSDDSLFVSSRGRVDLLANGSSGPINITAGQSVILSWTSANTKKCFFGSVSKAKNGSETVNPIASTIYSINCTDDDGNKVFDTVSVNIVTTSATSSQPFVDLKVNGQDSNIFVSPGNTIAVSWTSRNVTSCQTGSTTRPIFGSFDYVVPEAFSASALTSLDVSISCFGQNGTVSDVVIINLNSSATGQNLINTSNLAGQVALNTTNTAVYFSGTMKTAGKCDGEDDFYRVFISPKDGTPVVSAVDNLQPSNYGVGNPSTVLKLLYWDHGDIPTPVNGSTVIGESDGVKIYNCSYSGSAPSGDVIDAGVIFGVGQLPESAMSSGNSSTTNPFLASVTGVTGEAGVVPQEEASAAALKIKDKDGGFLGTGISLAEIVAVVAVAACATGVGCLLTASYYAYYSAAAVVAYWAGIAVVGYAIGSVGDAVVNNSGSNSGGL